jgi:hypothetical protein
MVDFVRNYQTVLEELISLKSKVSEYRQLIVAFENENKKLKNKIELTNDFIVKFIGEGCNSSFDENKSYESMNKKFSYNKSFHNYSGYSGNNIHFNPNYISRNKINNPPININSECEPYSSVSSLTGFSPRLSEVSSDTKENRPKKEDSKRICENSENVVIDYKLL